MQVVLTGRCNANGRFTERSEVCRRAGNVGIIVQATVARGIDYLVASRADTVKARRAEAMGVHVIPYNELFGMIAARESADRTGHSPMTPDHDLDDRAAGRVRPITGPNGGRMASRETMAERNAEARKVAQAGLKITEPEDKPTQPRPHRMLDL